MQHVKRPRKILLINRAVQTGFQHTITTLFPHYMVVPDVQAATHEGRWVMLFRGSGFHFNWNTEAQNLPYAKPDGLLHFNRNRFHYSLLLRSQVAIVIIINCTSNAPALCAWCIITNRLGKCWGIPSNSP